MAIAIGGGDVPAHRKLGGYLRVAVSVPAAQAVAGSIRPLAPCSLTACGAVPLAPLPDDARATPRGSSKWRASAGGGGSSVVRQLRALAGHRCVEVEARVLRVVTRKRGRRRDGRGDGRPARRRLPAPRRLVRVAVPAPLPRPPSSSTSAIPPVASA